ncbi:MAG: 30S ribosomal protein S17 [Chloroflexi bacterium]|nr:30S ribosomal protein S17 [Chloroflexota bacterium]
MQKTVVVAVQSLRRHRLYQRTMRLTKNYLAHDEREEVRVGDLVRIQESRPISKHKHWRVIDILERAAERGKAIELPVPVTETTNLAAVATADVEPALASPGAGTAETQQSGR